MANTWHKISDFQTVVKVYGNVKMLGQAPYPNRASIALGARLAFVLITSPLYGWCKWGIAPFCSHALVFGILSSMPEMDGVFLAMTMQDPMPCVPNIAAFTVVVLLVD